MAIISWDQERKKWKGLCPRCGLTGFFDTHSTVQHAGFNFDTLLCASDHLFAVEHVENDVLGVHPREWKHKIPKWLPEKYDDCFEELLAARVAGHRRSVVAIAGILLEAHVNDILTSEGDKKKSLYDRLSILKEQGRIDPDQFSDATITRITRRDVLHPEGILATVTEEEADEVFEAVTSFLEREFKWRSARALPPGEGENTTDEQES